MQRQEVNLFMSVMNNNQLYRAQYSIMMGSYLDCEFHEVKDANDYEKMFDKASRLSNINAVKLCNDYKAIKIFKDLLYDLGNMGEMYKIEELTFLVEEMQSNKYTVTVMNNNRILHEFTIYAPNADTALNRSKMLVRYQTPLEL